MAIIFVYTYAIAPKSAADLGGFAKMNIRMVRRIVSTVPVLLLFAVNHGRNNQRILELGDTPIERDFGMKLNQVDLNFVHFFAARKSPVRPFLTSGIGSLRFSPTSEASALALSDEFIDEPTQLVSSRKLSVAFGGGIEARFSRWLGLRFDVKDYISAVPRFGVPQTSSGPGGIFFPVDGVLHNIEIGVGIVFFLLPK